MASMGVLLGGYLVGYSLINRKLLLASIATALVCGAGNALNDFFDYESDKINHPTRPLPSGNLPLYFAILAFIVMSLSAIIITLFVNLYITGSVLVALILLFAYDSALKKIPILGNQIVAVLGGMTLLTGALVGKIETAFVFPGALLPAIFAITIHFIREILKDLADYIGDRRFGVKSLPMYLSERKILAIISFGFLIIVFITIATIIADWYNVVYSIIVIALVDLPLIILILYLFSSTNGDKYKISASITKMLMLIGLLAFFFGRN